MKTVNLLMAIGLVALVSATQAAKPPSAMSMMPPYLNYQGRLMTPASVPYSNTTHTIVLSLYPTASGGAKMWSEQYSVQTRDGYFSVNLGSGGTPKLASNNVPIFQVLWSQAGAETNDFFMALTVATGPDGSPLASPLESTPRQQFMTAPFAFRAHQSAYARKADGQFDAPAGVQTPALSATNLALTALTNITLNAQNVDMVLPTSTATSNAFTINGKPLFVSQVVVGSCTTGSSYTHVESDIDRSFYDVQVVGWIVMDTNHIKGLYVSTGTSTASIYFAAPTRGTPTYQLWFLGIRKNVVDTLPMKSN